jgi:hypothetical protein
VKMHVLKEAEAEATEAACWYDDRQSGLGDQFLDQYALMLRVIDKEPYHSGRLETVA